MGTWGRALYSDDLVADIRDELRGLIAEGRSADDAVRWLARDHDNVRHRAVFWLAVADTAWRLG